SDPPAHPLLENTSRMLISPRSFGCAELTSTRQGDKRRQNQLLSLGIFSRAIRAGSCSIGDTRFTNSARPAPRLCRDGCIEGRCAERSFLCWGCPCFSPAAPRPRRRSRSSPLLHPCRWTRVRRRMVAAPTHAWG